MHARGRLAVTIGAIAGFALPATAGAATIEVDTNSDLAAADGECSLREAIAAANDDSAEGGCPTGDGKDKIAFDIAGPPVISVTTQLPDVTERAVIDGTTEPDFTGLPVVTIDNGGSVVTGLETTADKVVIKGLVITDFLGEGLRIDNDRNKIYGNFVGTDAAGADHGNGIGISLEGRANKVGGTGDGTSNFISGNGIGGGVGALGDDNVIRRNFIGLEPAGGSVLPNGSVGIQASGDGTVVAGNIISGNTAATGVQINGNDASVQGNAIGTDPLGAFARPNLNGVVVNGKRALIGGSKASSRNLISGNSQDGIRLLGEETAGRNRVLGNYIGTDGDGIDPLGNGNDGIEIAASNANVIGGREPGLGNLISDNIVGVRIGGIGEARDNLVRGNVFGTDVDGELDLGNQSGAVRLTTGAVDNTIGGTRKGEGNLMRFTPGGAISVGGGATSFGNSFVRNRAYDNGEEVIDLAEEGVTPNDVGPPSDTDTGPNNLQNFPVLLGGDEQTDNISGSLESTAQTKFRIEFFVSGQPDDAERFVGAKTIKTDGDGHDDFNFTSSKNLPAGDFLTATATRLDGKDLTDTSELSDDADVSVGP